MQKTVLCLVVLFHYWLKCDLIYSQCYTYLCYALVYNVYDVHIVCASVGTISASRLCPGGQNLRGDRIYTITKCRRNLILQW